jgi:hypothetical protein
MFLHTCSRTGECEREGEEEVQMRKKFHLGYWGKEFGTEITFFALTLHLTSASQYLLTDPKDKDEEEDEEEKELPTFTFIFTSTTFFSLFDSPHLKLERKASSSPFLINERKRGDEL